MGEMADDHLDREYEDYNTCVRCGKFVGEDEYRCESCEEIGTCQECIKKDKALTLAITKLKELNQNIIVDKIERMLE